LDRFKFDRDAIVGGDIPASVDFTETARANAALQADADIRCAFKKLSDIQIMIDRYCRSENGHIRGFFPVGVKSLERKR
jgi:hypothetical protein